MDYRHFAVLAALLALTGCDSAASEHWQGYVEGDSIFIAAPSAGALTEIAVEEGDQVSADAHLFSIDDEPQRAAEQQAEAQLQRARAELADLEKGKRPQELAVIEAQYEQAQAAAELSSKQLLRTRDLYANKLASRSSLDEAETAHTRNLRQIQEIEAQLNSARLAARSDQLEAAKAQVAAAQASLREARWSLQQKQQAAPTQALVRQVLYRPGEFVPAGQPVVELLPPERINVRFFVPETALHAIKTGDQVSVHCDGCGAPFMATVRYISPNAEFTPPYIYSKDSRDKFVYLVKAWPAADRSPQLHPGQPVDVAPPGLNAHE
ncbi:HlyD family secretion protein [Hahella sp. HN01]|uniref:HlyD family secretion protein n=1 Tax=Hahella sp. HN01 TaxID=2847262 RepID=UPI001C1EED89|nr:HlyD family efflux transporter periplasmic adaptor subunit [Hahella sp. HN01]MBU6950397.1 HlyD family efflux transporter periplasmic adaptor subunit [Hahella sp. HN01]